MVPSLRIQIYQLITPTGNGQRSKSGEYLSYTVELMQLLGQLANDPKFECSNLAAADTNWKWPEKKDIE
jgi:hypothetical protein